MPARNPWLTDSVYPTSHFNPGARGSVLMAGPSVGRKLTLNRDLKAVTNVMVSNPAVKKIVSDTVAFVSGTLASSSFDSPVTPWTSSPSRLIQDSKTRRSWPPTRRSTECWLRSTRHAARSMAPRCWGWPADQLRLPAGRAVPAGECTRFGVPLRLQMLIGATVGVFAPAGHQNSKTFGTRIGSGLLARQVSPDVGRCVVEQSNHPARSKIAVFLPALSYVSSSPAVCASNIARMALRRRGPLSEGLGSLTGATARATLSSTYRSSIAHVAILPRVDMRRRS